ncbi:N-carbamoyl-L-amino acid hydrolase [compost metagenome]
MRDNDNDVQDDCFKGNHIQDKCIQDNTIESAQHGEARTSPITVNAARLQHNIETLGKIGLNAEGGLDRTTFTPAELEARAWLIDELDRLGLDVSLDSAANIWARRQGNENGLAPIVFGSHIDTVPSGGRYDGALGILLSLEIMRVLKERGLKTRHPLELVSFSAEEPNPFGLSTFGSRSVAGKLGRADLEGVQDADGVLLIDALRLAGGDPDGFEACRRSTNDMAAFLEVHIEQGKRLQDGNIPVGIVTAITGIYREEVVVLGEANHAGTTLMIDRIDALMGASELMLAFEAECRMHPEEETVGTIGRIHNEPNAANIIPGKVSFHLEIRGRSRAHIQQVLDAWELHASRICSERELRLKRHLLLDQAPVAMSDKVIDFCKREAERLGYSYALLGSMAGHDAAHMAVLTKAGMLFVPSLGGKSHCPEEESLIEDIEKVGNVLLHTILSLDQQGNEAE